MAALSRRISAAFCPPDTGCGASILSSATSGLVMVLAVEVVDAGDTGVAARGVPAGAGLVSEDGWLVGLACTGAAPGALAGAEASAFGAAATAADCEMLPGFGGAVAAAAEA